MLVGVGLPAVAAVVAARRRSVPQEQQQLPCAAALGSAVRRCRECCAALPMAQQQGMLGRKFRQQMSSCSAQQIAGLDALQQLISKTAAALATADGMVA